MAEYVATITIRRSARGEGDVPITVLAASSTAHATTSSEKLVAVRKAVADASAIVVAGLAAFEQGEEI